MFTHLLPDEVETYLSEIERVLAPVERCFASFFLLNEESLDSSRLGRSIIDFKHDFGEFRTKSKDMPEAAIALPVGLRASHQRCQVHYARNLLGMVGSTKRKELAADLCTILAAPAREQALRIASTVSEKWRLKKGHPKIAERLEEHFEECLSCLAFPESHRWRVRTTNGPERLNQAIKRRTRVVRIFPQSRILP